MKTILAGLTILLFGVTVNCVSDAEQAEPVVKAEPTPNWPPTQVFTKPDGSPVVYPTVTPTPTPSTCPNPKWTREQCLKQAQYAAAIEQPPPMPTPAPKPPEPPEMIESVEDFEAWCESEKPAGFVRLEQPKASEEFSAMWYYNHANVWKGVVRSPLARRSKPLEKVYGETLDYAVNENMLVWSLPAGSHCIKVESGQSMVSHDPDVVAIVQDGRVLQVAKDRYTVVRLSQEDDYELVLQSDPSRRFCENVEERARLQDWELKEREELHRLQQSESATMSKAALELREQQYVKRKQVYYYVSGLLVQYDVCRVQVNVLTYFPNEFVCWYSNPPQVCSGREGER